MNKLHLFLFILSITTQFSCIRNNVPQRIEPFQPHEVKLLAGPFKSAHDTNISYIFRIDPDRLLFTFRENSGIPNKEGVLPYGGWESPGSGLRGHTTGHCLTALSLLYASDENTEAKKRLDYLVSELKACQDSLGNGYLSAFPESVFDEIEKSGEGWAPHYTIHKILQGMLDAYTFSGNKEALECAVKMGDWLTNRCDKITNREVWKSILDKIETGGICESMANLAMATGNEKYIRTAEFFVQDSKFYPALSGIDNLNGKITSNYHHANTTIPQFIGLLRLYQSTGKADYLKASQFFWNQVAMHRSYATGGTGFHEHWNYGPDTLSRELDYQAQETCCSYNMLKLTHDLLSEMAYPEYSDYYEKVLFNHILSSRHPENGRMIYMLSLRPGHWKMFGNEEDAFWCCQGTGIENPNRFGEAIYFKNKDNLFVNLFIASRLEWVEKNITITQQTSFPYDNISFLKISGNKTAFGLNIRVPYWAKEGIRISINGQDFKTVSESSGYITINRKWENNDEVKLEIPMSVHLEFLPDDPTYFAILYGPVVLAGALGREGMPYLYTNNTYYNPPPDSLLSYDMTPVLEVSTKKLDWVKRLDSQKLNFLISDLNNEFYLKPLFEIYDEKYQVYWKLSK